MADHVYALTITTQCGSQFCQNVLHYRFDDTSFSSTELAANALCTAWNLANKTGFRNLLPTAAALKSLKARAIDQPGGFEAFFPITIPFLGNRAGVLEVSGTGPCIVLYPASPARSRGRVFIPGITDNDAVDGEIQAGLVAAFTANEHIFRDTLTLVGGGSPVATPVIKSSPPSTATHLIQHTALTPYVCTQRRRMKPV